MNYKNEWKQAAGKAVKVIFPDATQARKEKLLKELTNFVNDCFIDELKERLSQDDIRDHDSYFWEDYGRTVFNLERCEFKNYGKHHNYFYHQLIAIAVLATEVANPSEYPVAILEVGKAAELFGVKAELAQDGQCITYQVGI